MKMSDTIYTRFVNGLKKDYVVVATKGSRSNCVLDDCELLIVDPVDLEYDVNLEPEAMFGEMCRSAACFFMETCCDYGSDGLRLGSIVQFDDGWYCHDVRKVGQE